ncbi:unnamed protein product [Amoebophrya sp. A25]|nr:unnamed protein product [Amoebophrya sp. A25]|eukprot:GSA25T00017865001.1
MKHKNKVYATSREEALDRQSIITTLPLQRRDKEKAITIS